MLGFLKMLFFLLIIGVVGFAMLNMIRAISDLSQRVDTIGKVNTAIQTDMGKLYDEIQRATADDESEEEEREYQAEPKPSACAATTDQTHRPRCPIQFTSSRAAPVSYALDDIDDSSSHNAGSIPDECDAGLPLQVHLNDLDGSSVDSDALVIDSETFEESRKPEAEVNGVDGYFDIDLFSSFAQDGIVSPSSTGSNLIIEVVYENVAYATIEAADEITNLGRNDVSSQQSTQSFPLDYSASVHSHHSAAKDDTLIVPLEITFDADDSNTVVSALTVNVDFVGLTLSALRKQIKDRGLHSAPSTLKKAECLAILRQVME